MLIQKSTMIQITHNVKHTDTTRHHYHHLKLCQFDHLLIHQMYTK